MSYNVTLTWAQATAISEALGLGTNSLAVQDQSIRSSFPDNQTRALILEAISADRYKVLDARDSLIEAMGKALPNI